MRRGNIYEASYATARGIYPENEFRLVTLARMFLQMGSVKFQSITDYVYTHRVDIQTNFHFHSLGSRRNASREICFQYVLLKIALVDYS